MFKLIWPLAPMVALNVLPIVKVTCFPLGMYWLVLFRVAVIVFVLADTVKVYEVFAGVIYRIK